MKDNACRKKMPSWIIDVRKTLFFRKINLESQPLKIVMIFTKSIRDYEFEFY